MPDKLTTAQAKSFYNHGYVVLRNVIPKADALAARRLLFQRLGNLTRGAVAAVRSGTIAELEEVVPLIFRGGADERITGLIEHTPLLNMLSDAMGCEPLPIRGAQLATLFPAEDDLTVNEAGFYNRDTPFNGWCGHLDGLWNGGGPTPPIDTELDQQQETLWQGDVGTNGSPKRHDTFNTNIRNFTALVGIVLSDQSREGAGNLGLLRGGHRHMEKFFRAQAAAGGPLGPDGPGWPRVDQTAPNKHGLVHYPDKVKKVYQRAAVKTGSNHIWPKPTFIKAKPGDAVIVHHATPHSGSRVMTSDPRMMIYFRVTSSARSEKHLEVYPESLTDNWREWPGILAKLKP